MWKFLHRKHQRFGTSNARTSERLPVELVYTEEYNRIDEAYYLERQIHGWSRDKKIVLIDGRNADLPGLAILFFAGLYKIV